VETSSPAHHRTIETALALKLHVLESAVQGDALDGWSCFSMRSALPDVSDTSQLVEFESGP
jgi:hypothetical protein